MLFGQHKKNPAFCKSETPVLIFL